MDNLLVLFEVTNGGREVTRQLATGTLHKGLQDARHTFVREQVHKVFAFQADKEEEAP